MSLVEVLERELDLGIGEGAGRFCCDEGEQA
jgi:hypothetical protein